MMYTIDYSRPWSNPPHLQHPFPSIFTGVNVPNSISRKSVVPSAGPKSSNVNLKIDASRRNVPWHMLPLKRLGRWWVGWEELFGLFFFLGGVWFTVVRMVLMFIAGISMRNKLIMKKISRNWGSGSGWNTVQVGWWFLVQVFWAQLFWMCWSVNLQGLEEKVATKCRFLADRKAEDSQKDLVWVDEGSNF